MWRIWLVALAVLASCKHDTPAPPPPPDPLAVTLVDPGKEPRRVLHYQLAKGTTTSLELAIDVDVSAGEIRSPSPTLVFALELVVEDVLPDGRMKLRSKIVDATARDRAGGTVPASAMTGPLEQMKGIAITATLAPDGKLDGTHVEIGAKPLPDAVVAQLSSLTKSLDQLAMPLPKQPVGIGAKWQTAKTVAQDGMQLASTTTVEVTALDGTAMGYTMRSEIRGADQQVAQGTRTIDVAHVTGGGSGAGTVALDKLSLDGTFTAQFSADMTADGQHTPVGMTMTMTTKPR